MSFTASNLPTFPKWLKEVKKNKNFKAVFKKPGVLVGIIVVAFLLIGMVAASVLTQINQDVRQQAMIVTPGGGGGGETSCSQLGGNCKSSCSSNENEGTAPYGCSTKCCLPKPAVMNVPSPAPMVCTPNETKCDNVYQKKIKCLPDGTGWVFTNDKCYDVLPNTANIVRDKCVVNSRKCASSKYFFRCEPKSPPDFTYLDWVGGVGANDNYKCSGDSICSNGECISPNNPVCPVGSISAPAPAGTLAQNLKCRCKTIVGDENFDFPRVNGAILPPECTAGCAQGATKCSGRLIRTCIGGLWTDTRRCPEQEQCYKDTNGDASCGVPPQPDDFYNNPLGGCWLPSSTGGECIQRIGSVCDAAADQPGERNKAYCERYRNDSTVYKKCCNLRGQAIYLNMAINHDATCVGTNYPYDASGENQLINSCPTFKKCCSSDGSTLIPTNQNCPSQYPVAINNLDQQCPSRTACYKYISATNVCENQGDKTIDECREIGGKDLQSCQNDIYLNNRTEFSSTSTCGCRCNVTSGSIPFFLSQSVSDTPESCSNQANICSRSGSANVTGTTTWVSCNNQLSISPPSQVDTPTTSTATSQSGVQCGCKCNYYNHAAVFLPNVSSSLSCNDQRGACSNAIDGTDDVRSTEWVSCGATPNPACPNQAPHGSTNDICGDYFESRSSCRQGQTPVSVMVNNPRNNTCTRCWRCDEAPVTQQIPQTPITSCEQAGGSCQYRCDAVPTWEHLSTQDSSCVSAGKVQCCKPRTYTDDQCSRHPGYQASRPSCRASEVVDTLRIDDNRDEIFKDCFKCIPAYQVATSCENEGGSCYWNCPSSSWQELPNLSCRDGGPPVCCKLNPDARQICCEITQPGSSRKYYLKMASNRCSSLRNDIGAIGSEVDSAQCSSTSASETTPPVQGGSPTIAQVPTTTSTTPTATTPVGSGTPTPAGGGGSSTPTPPAPKPQTPACNVVTGSILGVFCDGTMEEVKDSNGKATCECVRKTKVFTFGGSGQGSLSHGYRASTLATDDSNLVTNYQKICGEVNKTYGANKDNYACFADLVFMKQSSTSLVGYEYATISSTVKQILAVKKDSLNKKVVPRIALHLNIPKDLTADELSAQIKEIYKGGIGGLEFKLFSDQIIQLSLDLTDNRFSSDDLTKIYTAYKEAQVAAGHKFVAKNPFKLFIYENVRDSVIANADKLNTTNYAQFVPIDAVGGAADLATKQKRAQTVSNAYYGTNVNKNIAGDLVCMIWNGEWVTKLTPAQQIDGVTSAFTDAMFKQYFINKAASGTNKYNYQCDYYGVY